jgi:hypothetical protein
MMAKKKKKEKPWLDTNQTIRGGVSLGAKGAKLHLILL